MTKDKMAPAVTRKDVLKRAAGLEGELGQKPFLGGSMPSAADVKEFNAMLGNNAELARWCKHVGSTPPADRKAWPAEKRAYSTMASVGGTAGKQSKAERKAEHALAGNITVTKREVKREKLHPDCLDDLPDQPNFCANEDEVQEYWKKIDAFRTSVKRSEGKKPFSFYDGPPFATGLPHYGHILAGTIKDVVCRWAHQTGHHVERRFGWDCHGLPIEFEIEKLKGIKSSKDIIGPGGCGIAQYNEWCREIVMRFAGEWETIVGRMGRWIDFKNDYKTMNASYMESVWWVFKSLWDKGLVYKGFKVMPYSWACTTVLSNHEAGMNYEEVSDPAVVVNFPLVEDSSVALLAWTTTPWTLPSNLMLCVNADMTYVQVQDNKTEKKYILAKERLVQLYPELAKPKKGAAPPYKEIKTYTGKELVGKEYEPLFDFFLRKKKDGCFKVVSDDYVTSSDGTGIVHQAPGFGADDFRVCMKAGVLAKDEKVPCPVDENGDFTSEIPTFEGKNIKAADPFICEALKAAGRLVSKGAIKHKYPFCWRSDKPLIYKACPSWFVNVSKIKDQILESSDQTRWVPEVVRTGRFNNLVKDAPDWAVSRSRYWGCPLPIWESADSEERVCVGSIEELEKLTGKKVDDLHRHHIDELTIPDPRGGDRPPMKRVPDVFDCWFESGSMPYGQGHYPFENKEKFEKTFPADFIAEGLDQTRGWFNSLLVLSTALFGKPCFKNLIVNGLVLASDGKKMSKRLKNYPDPMEIVKKHCADALRLYLINSPVVQGQELRFKAEGVKDVVKEVILPVYHALKFFTIQHNRLILAGHKFDAKAEGDNVMDQWIKAAGQKLVTYLHEEMGKYKLSTVLQSENGVIAWIDNLTNWYVRMNRPRLKGVGGDLKDWQAGLASLFQVLILTSKVMAPFTPHIAEYMWRQLCPLLPEGEREDSVHYTEIPEVEQRDAKQSAADTSMLNQVDTMQRVTKLVRLVRDRKGLGLRKPVKEVVVIHREAGVVEDVKAMRSYIMEEVNTFDVVATTAAGEWVTTTAEPCKPGLGKRFKQEKDKWIKKVESRSQEELVRDLVATGKVTVDGEDLTTDEISLVYTFREDRKSYEYASDDGLLVLMSTEQNQAVILEGAAREFASRVQALRKHAQLRMEDKVTVLWSSDNETLIAALEQKAEGLASQVMAKSIKRLVGDAPPGVVASQEYQFGDSELVIKLSE